jgi:ribosome-binding protein aMBF1 (putative translation factor)
VTLTTASSDVAQPWEADETDLTNKPQTLRQLRLVPETTQHIQTRVGLAIRRRRRLVDMTLRQLADACGVSFQQVHKYEAAECSVSAVQLWKIACALGVPITYFFEGVQTSDCA